MKNFPTHDINKKVDAFNEALNDFEDYKPIKFKYDLKYMSTEEYTKREIKIHRAYETVNGQ